MGQGEHLTAFSFTQYWEKDVLQGQNEGESVTSVNNRKGLPFYATNAAEISLYKSNIYALLLRHKQSYLSVRRVANIVGLAQYALKRSKYHPTTNSL